MPDSNSLMPLPVLLIVVALVALLIWFIKKRPVARLNAAFETTDESKHFRLILYSLMAYGALCLLAVPFVVGGIDPTPYPNALFPANRLLATLIGISGGFILATGLHCRLRHAAGLLPKVKYALWAVPGSIGLMMVLTPKSVPINGGIIWPFLIALGLQRQIDRHLARAERRPENRVDAAEAPSAVASVGEESVSAPQAAVSGDQAPAIAPIAARRALTSSQSAPRWYFMITAILGTQYAVSFLSKSQVNLVVLGLTAPILVFAALFTYIAIKYDHVIRHRAAFIRYVIIAACVFRLLSYGFLAANTRNPVFFQKTLPSVILSFVVLIYLFRSVNRISAELAATLPTSPSMSPEAPQA